MRRPVLFVSDQFCFSIREHRLSLSPPLLFPRVWRLCVWQWVWPPSVLSHALLSIRRLWHSELTIFPSSSTCFFITFWLTTSFSLSISLSAPPPIPHVYFSLPVHLHQSVPLSLLRGFLGLLSLLWGKMVSVSFVLFPVVSSLPLCWEKEMKRRSVSKRPEVASIKMGKKDSFSIISGSNTEECRSEFLFSWSLMWSLHKSSWPKLSRHTVLINY